MVATNTCTACDLLVVIAMQTFIQFFFVCFDLYKLNADFHFGRPQPNEMMRHAWLWGYYPSFCYLPKLLKSAVAGYGRLQS